MTEFINCIDIYSYPLPEPGGEPIEVDLAGGLCCIVLAEERHGATWYCVELRAPNGRRVRFYRSEPEVVRDLVGTAASIADVVCGVRV